MRRYSKLLSIQTYRRRNVRSGKRSVAIICSWATSNGYGRASYAQSTKRLLIAVRMRPETVVAVRGLPADVSKIFSPSIAAFSALAKSM